MQSNLYVYTQGVTHLQVRYVGYGLNVRDCMRAHMLLNSYECYGWVQVQYRSLYESTVTVQIHENKTLFTHTPNITIFQFQKDFLKTLKYSSLKESCSSWNDKPSCVKESNINNPIFTLPLHDSVLRRHLQTLNRKRNSLYNCCSS